MNEKWIGRIDKETKKVQGLKEHLNNVGRYSAEFASKIGLEKVGRLIGLLHDMGKASNEFRDYILKVIENPKLFSSEKIDHSTASSKYLYEKYNPKSLDEKFQFKKILLEIITVSMMGHHGGLMNFVDKNAESPYINRVKKKLDNYDEVKNNFLMDLYSETQIDKLFEEAVEELYKYINGSIKPFEVGMTIKFLHSCLIDADRLDAFRFSNDVKYYSQKADFLVYKTSLEKYISKFKSKSTIDDMRTQISNECAAAGKKGIGTYTLTIPTGGGKTLSSVRFALEHAVTNNLDRIIYIVPYLSIIEQNAEVIKEALELDDELLEFHSNIINNDVDDDAGEGYFQQLILSERFDKPIIFTSMVQFLEIFYDKKNSKGEG